MGGSLMGKIKRPTTPPQAKKHYRAITSPLDPDKKDEAHLLWEIWHQMREKYSGDRDMVMIREKGGVSLWALKSLTKYDNDEGDHKLEKSVTRNIVVRNQLKPVPKEVRWHKNLGVNLQN